MRTRYDVWYDALVTAHTGDHYGVTLGAHYMDVLKWLPVLSPYGVRGRGTDPEFIDAVYSVTHVVYTLNNYWTYRLDPRLLPRECWSLSPTGESSCAGAPGGLSAAGLSEPPSAPGSSGRSSGGRSLRPTSASPRIRAAWRSNGRFVP